jgi:hypothetical protein
MPLLSVLRRTVSVGLVVLAGCSGKHDDAPACVANLPKTCMPLYDPPTYSTIFDKILNPTCAEGIATCHTSDGAKGGLVFENADDSYAMLLGQRGSRAKVLPNDAACSLIMIKTESTDPTFRMPPGNMGLSMPELCDIQMWIEQGAQR